MVSLLKATTAEAKGLTITAAAYNKQREKVVLIQGSNLQSCNAGLLHRAPDVCAIVLANFVIKKNSIILHLDHILQVF